MIRAPQRLLKLMMLSALTVVVALVAVLFGGSLHDLLLVGGAALSTLLCLSLLSMRGGTRAEPVLAPASPPEGIERLRLQAAVPLRAGLVNDTESPLERAVIAFQHECSELLLDAEAARVQTESCEGGVRAVDQASRSLAATCDVLGRRAGLTQSHALMARCAMADAAECLRHAVDEVETWHLSAARGVPDDGGSGGPGRLGEAAMESLARAGEALGAALERGDEAARVAAELGGAAARGQRHALNLSEACAGLAPSLDESARTGLRLAMLAASLDENAGRVSRMLGAAASGHRWPQPGGAAKNWRGAAPGDGAQVTGDSGNVVYVRFQGTRGKPGVEQA